MKVCTHSTEQWFEIPELNQEICPFRLVFRLYDDAYIPWEVWNPKHSKERRALGLPIEHGHEAEVRLIVPDGTPTPNVEEMWNRVGKKFYKVPGEDIEFKVDSFITETSK